LSNLQRRPFVDVIIDNHLIMPFVCTKKKTNHAKKLHKDNSILCGSEVSSLIIPSSPQMDGRDGLLIQFRLTDMHALHAVLGKKETTKRQSPRLALRLRSAGRRMQKRGQLAAKPEECSLLVPLYGVVKASS
jgi:hypothetical protein